MATESGYSNQKKLGLSQFKTIQNLGTGIHGAPSLIRTVYQKAVPAPIVAVTPILGFDGQVRELEIELTAHGAVPGNWMKMTSGTIIDWIFEIIRIVDVDKFIVLPIAPSLPLVAEDAEILGHTTLRTSQDGNIGIDPTGLATAGKQDEQTTELQAIRANQDYSPLGFVDLDFSVTNVDNLAYVELLADTGGTQVRKVQIFMSSGDPLFLAYGAAASEVNQIIVIPGGNGLIDLVIPANTRLSLRAVDAVTVSAGRIIVNLLG